MTDPRALAELERLRRRACDTAERRLVEARHRFAACEERRRGWRARLDAEAADAPDTASVARWLEACRTRERALAEEAARLADVVAAAERERRTAQLQLEQIEALRARQRESARRAALRREQRRLDELKPMRGI
jgi:flagellar biosynthesis chaperone FliJ